jgi:RND family efflux transporter MFP subunit
MRAITTSLALGIMLMPGAWAQQGPPAANVALGPVTRGTLSPSTSLPGAVYFKEVSSLATEVGGKVTEVLFEEGQHLPQGAPMMRQDATLLRAELEASRAAAAQVEAQLEQEMVRLERAKLLLADEVTTPQEFDDIRFTVDALRHRLDASRAAVTRLEQELAKKATHAPYDGVVISRQTELGEWKRDGDPIAVFARDNLYDVIVNLPESQLPYVKIGANVEVTVHGKTFPGEIVTVIPRGDTVTRTFPVKIRVEGQNWLLEGMSADVAMPRGETREALMVPRDAVLNVEGRDVVYIVEDDRARQLPVEVLGYQGLMAGVENPELNSESRVITKGHERLRPGQAVRVGQ